MAAGLTPKEVAAQLGVHTDTLKNWRAGGTGPKWFRMGPRLIRYPADGIEAWLAERPDSNRGSRTPPGRERREPQTTEG